MSACPNLCPTCGRDCNNPLYAHVANSDTCWRFRARDALRILDELRAEDKRLRAALAERDRRVAELEAELAAWRMVASESQANTVAVVVRESRLKQAMGLAKQDGDKEET